MPLYPAKPLKCKHVWHQGTCHHRAYKSTPTGLIHCIKCGEHCTWWDKHLGLGWTSGAKSLFQNETAHYCDCTYNGTDCCPNAIPVPPRPSNGTNDTGPR